MHTCKECGDMVFQSTPPREGVTSDYHHMRQEWNVSIHTPP